MGSSCKDCSRWNNCLAAFLPCSPHTSTRVHKSLTIASHSKNDQTLCAVSLSTTTPCARWSLITVCPMKSLDGSFVLLATTEQDKPLSSPLPVFEDACLRCDSHTVTLFTTCFYGVSIEFDTVFSRVHTFQACHWCTLPCLFLIQGLAQQEQSCDPGPQVQ